MKILYGSTTKYGAHLSELLPLARPYFDPVYASIMSRVEMGGAPEFFLLHGKSGYVYYQFIRRAIHLEIPTAPKHLSDITTPLDYGGYYTNNPGLLGTFMDHFGRYCAQQGIIAEFLRLLPTWPHDYHRLQKHIRLREMRGHIHLDLGNMNFEREFDTRRRRELNKQAHANFTFACSNDITPFWELYCETMQRRKAHRYYYFNRQILDELLSTEMAEIWNCQCDGSILSSYFMLKSDDTLYYFLGANSEQGLSCGSATKLFYRIGKHYCVTMKKLFLGGGDDGVYEFKKGFSKRRDPYFIGMKIHNPEHYRDLVERTNRHDNDFFPQYRDKII